MSPYPYATAAEHYAALQAAAETRGGPTKHTRTTMPDWDGWYRRGARENQWTYGRNLQTSTLVSLLTPEYQKRLVQMGYHESVSNSAQWMAAFCYPEGLMRWWAEFSMGEIEVLVTPHQVQLTAGVADNFVRKILIDQKHVMEVPQWYGESVGFWNGNQLVVWTANVQAWTLSHSMFEYSPKLEVIETFTPDENGSLTVEATFYDPEAFARPLHVATPWNRTGGIDNAEKRYTFVECRVQSTIVNGPDGRPTQLTFVDDGYIDYFGRPWAQNWEEHFQRGDGPMAMPHGVAPTRMVVTTFKDAASMTETSFEDPLAVYRNLPSDVSPMPQGRAPTRTSATTLDVARSMTETVRARPFATYSRSPPGERARPIGSEPAGSGIVSRTSLLETSTTTTLPPCSDDT